MRFKDNESGQVLVITAVYMVLFLGFLAFAIDVGILFHTRWQLQVAADSAATAAAVQSTSTTDTTRPQQEQSGSAPPPPTMSATETP